MTTTIWEIATNRRKRKNNHRIITIGTVRTLPSNSCMMNHDGLVCLIGVKETHVILVQAKNKHHQGWLLLPCQDVVRMSSGCLLALESLVFLSLGFFVFTFLRLKEIQCDCIDRERFLNRSFGHTSQLKSCSCKVSWHGLRCKQQKQLRQCRPMTSHGAEEQQFQPGHTYLL